MTDELWQESFVKHMIREIRRVVPEGWVFLSMDQYGSHVNTYAALKYLRDNHILAYSPHAKSTYFTQALDQQIIRAVKARYRQLLRQRGESGLPPPSKWEIPALVDSAWKEVLSGERGKSIVVGAFRKVGIEPLDRNFVESTKHLHGLSVTVDDGMERDREAELQELLRDGNTVALLDADGEKLGQGVVMLSVSNIHHSDIKADEVALQFVALEPGADAPLVYKDPFEGGDTLASAWAASLGHGFVTAWPKALIGPADGGEGRAPVILRKKSTLPSVFGVGSVTSGNVAAVVSNPKFEEACKTAAGILFDDNSHELSGATGVEFVKHVFELGGSLAAAAQRAWPQVEPSSRKRRSDYYSDDDDGSGDKPKAKRQSKVLAALGETSSQPKILNSPRRMARHKAYEDAKAAEAAAQSQHTDNRCDLVVTVALALKLAGIYGAGDVTSGKTPTIDDMKTYITKGGNPRILAFTAYKNAHSLQGKSVPYHYLFDFVHGGAENHPTVIEGVAKKLVIESKKSVQKTIGARPHPPTVPGVEAPNVVSEVVLV